MARIPLVVPGVRIETAAIERTIAAERGGAISPLYQALLNSAPLADGWERLLTALRNRSSVPPAIRELVILRIAVLNRAPFEYEAHRPIARRVGIDAPRLAAVARDDLEGATWSQDERAALALADSMTRDIQVPTPVFEAASSRFDTQVLIELVATIAAYNMVSRFLEALEIGH